MIKNTHPILKLLEETDWEFILVGSRYVGKFDRDNSDYDFLVVCEKWYGGKLQAWLKQSGFKMQGPDGYGPDRRLLGTNVWSKTVDGFPSVDVLPVTKAESELRLRFFKAMRSRGDTSGGMLAKGLKEGRVWANLWEVLAEFEAVKGDGGE